VKKSKEKHIQI